MACLRSLSNRTNLLRQRRQPPAFAYVLHDNDPKREQSPLENHGIAPRIPDYTPSHFSGFASPLQRSSFYRFSFPVCTGAGASFARYMSTAGGGGGASEGVDVASVLKDGAEVLTEAVTAQAPVVSEVAAAAADCSPPVAALQYLIDWVHCFTGFNWWASIVVTTLLIRVTTVPLLINQLKATHKLSLLRPQLEEIGQKVKDQSMDVAEGQQKLKKLYAEYNVSPLTPLKGLLIQGPLFISFFFAISNMVEKVPSLKSGGAFWFVDLTTPDSLYIFPVLTALTFWITVECNVQEGMEGNAYAGTMKNISRIFAAASIPLTMGFQKAIFCYWITSNLFSLTYGLVLKAPGVKKFLGVPEVPVARPPTTPQPSFSLSSALKQYKELSEKRAASASPSVEPVKLSDRKISSSSVLSERIKRLEKQVKGKKKNKKK